MPLDAFAAHVPEEGSANSDDDSGNEWEYKADKSVRVNRCVTPHASRVTRHASRVTCHVSRVTHAASRFPRIYARFYRREVRKLMSEQTLTSPSLPPRTRRHPGGGGGGAAGGRPP